MRETVILLSFIYALLSFKFTHQKMMSPLQMQYKQTPDLVLGTYVTCKLKLLLTEVAESLINKSYFFLIELQS